MVEKLNPKKVHLDVLDVIEEDDGGAIISFKVNNEGLQFLMQYAIKDMLMKAIQKPILKKPDDSEESINITVPNIELESESNEDCQKCGCTACVC